MVSVVLTAVVGVVATLVVFSGVRFQEWRGANDESGERRDCYEQ